MKRKAEIHKESEDQPEKKKRKRSGESVFGIHRWIRKDYAKKIINKVPFFISLDETTDVSQEEQLVITISHLNDKNKLETKFLQNQCFLPKEKDLFRAVYSSLKEFFKKVDPSFEK